MSVKSRIEQQIIVAVLSGRTLPPEAQLLRARDLEHPIAGIVLGDIADMRQFGHRNTSGAQTASDLVASKAYRFHFGLSGDTLTRWCEPEITDAELAGGIRMFLRLGADNEIKDLSSAVVQSLPWNDNGYLTGIYQRDLGAAITRRFERWNSPTPRTRPATSCWPATANPAAAATRRAASYRRRNRARRAADQPQSGVDRGHASLVTGVEGPQLRP